MIDKNFASKNPDILLILISMVALGLLISCHGPTHAKNETHYSQVHGDSGISGRSYGEIVAELQSLEVAFPAMAKVILYGKSLGGVELTMIRIGKGASMPTSMGGNLRPGVIIEGSIHGNEFLNIEDRLPRWFLEHQDSPGVAKYLGNGGVIWVVPILNPDGYTARRRENNQGQDLNRDFDMKLAKKVGFSQPETKALYETVKSELVELKAKLQLTFDYHCCVGAIIYPWGHSQDLEMPPTDRNEHLRIVGLMHEQFPSYSAGRAIQIVNYTAVGAADDFYHETFGSRSFTFEGAEGVEDKNFDRHTAMWDRLLADQAGSGSLPPNGSVPSGVSVAGNSASLRLAVASDDRQGNIAFAASMDGAGSLTLCRGDAALCRTGGPAVTTFQSSSGQGGRAIYRATNSVATKTGDIFTLVAKDSAGQISGFVALKLVAKIIN